MKNSAADLLESCHFEDLENPFSKERSSSTNNTTPPYTIET
jgi:hypothetical protein